MNPLLHYFTIYIKAVYIGFSSKYIIIVAVLSCPLLEPKNFVTSGDSSDCDSELINSIPLIVTLFLLHVIQWWYSETFFTQSSWDHKDDFFLTGIVLQNKMTRKSEEGMF